MSLVCSPPSCNKHVLGRMAMECDLIFFYNVPPVAFPHCFPFLIGSLFTFVSLHFSQSNALGTPALLCAARSGHASVVHALIASGAVLHDTTWPITPLMIAAQHGVYISHSWPNECEHILFIFMHTSVSSFLPASIHPQNVCTYMLLYKYN